MMISKKSMCGAVVGGFFLLSLHAADGKTVWEERFVSNGNIRSNGYSLVRDNKKDTFEVKDGVLTVSFFNSPYKGTYFRKNAPVIPAGEFSFELKSCVNGKLNSDNLSLKLHYGQHVFSFRFPHWEVYDPVRKKWFAAGDVKDREWHRYKIRFDAQKKLAEYFIDDMENPVSVREDFIFDPKILPCFGIENYGLSMENISYSLRNLRMTELSGASADPGSIRLEGTALFRGISASEWPLDRLVKKLGEKTVRTYVLETPGAHVDNGSNWFDLQPKPPRQPSSLPKNIILADIPLSALPPYFHQHILQSVRAGGRLIILRGYYSLNKGNYSGSVLEKILPVTVNDKWGEPRPLSDAKTVKRNGKTVLAIRKYGKGSVMAALEMPHLEHAGDCLLEYDFEKEG